jgi:RimJ/RimL family protein N-acetyltransferase
MSRMSDSAAPSPSIPKLAELPQVIETARLILRPLEPRDADDLWTHASDPAVSRYMAWATHRDKHETRAFIDAQIEARARGTDLAWAIVPSGHDGRASGCIGLHGITWTFRAWRIDRAELGYWLGAPLWARGLMTEAATAATTWAFETLGLHKITIGCIEGNRASQKIIEKLGYRFLAKHEDDVWRDGRWWNHLRYELLASEWNDVARTRRFHTT